MTPTGCRSRGRGCCPTGATGSTRGVAFYRALLTRLRERGIAPVVTLYHWDLPRNWRTRAGGPSAPRPRHSPGTRPRWPANWATWSRRGPP
nr:family 1 glycosylhydrolase [Tessaracoccus coleopterorum]